MDPQCASVLWDLHLKRLKDVLSWAERSAAETHNHPEGIGGAQATAFAVYLARNGLKKTKSGRS
jgi:ADP-ribosylglycohydrolase